MCLNSCVVVTVADLVLSDKYKAFLRHDAPVEYLEGTTAAGKTTVGMFKFMLRVAESSNQQHIISGLDLGTVEKNIIRKELGIQDILGIWWSTTQGAAAEIRCRISYSTR